jgi:hypothetical protein
MYLAGSAAALSAAADKAIAAGRSCMWASVLEHLTIQGCLGKTLQVLTDCIPADEHSAAEQPLAVV